MSLERLLKGFRAFRSSYFEKTSFYKELVVHGQLPETLVIACSDSRADPALLMQSKPGDLFVVRNVAAIVPPYQPDDHYHGTSAAIEFAVKGLKVKHIIVLGHAICGGVRALADADEAQGAKEQPDAGGEFQFLSRWISIGRETRDKVAAGLGAASRAQRLQTLEQAMVLTSLGNLMTFPWIRDRVESGKISMHGWYFDMINGRLLSYDFAEGIFTDVRKVDAPLAAEDQGCACGASVSVDDFVRKVSAE